MACLFTPSASAPCPNLIYHHCFTASVLFWPPTRPSEDSTILKTSWSPLQHSQWRACRHAWNVNVLWKLRCLESDHWHATGMLLPHHVGNVLVWSGFWHSEWFFSAYKSLSMKLATECYCHSDSRYKTHQRYQT